MASSDLVSLRLLCIDVGNSGAHLGFWKDGQLSELAEQPWPELVAGLAARLSTTPDVDGVAWCSVVPAAAEALRQALEPPSSNRAPARDCTVSAPSGRPISDDAGSWRGPVVEVSDRCAPGLSITYAQPSEIGPDRLANALGAQALVGLPALVIDLGTAATVSVIRRHEGYVGGMIAPGLGLLTEYLHQRTARLPRLTPEEVLNFYPEAGFPGRSTREAMLLGCRFGFLGLLRALLTQGLTMFPPQDGPPAIIVTGGAIPLVAGLPEAAHWHLIPRLTFHGLATAWQRLHRPI